jgi:predicted DNA repair protein MutK
VLSALSTIGTAAMLWVGGGIILHGLHALHLTPLPVWVEALSAPAHALPGVGGAAAWLVEALCGAALGLVAGGAVVGAVHFIPKKKGAKAQ